MAVTEQPQDSIVRPIKPMLISGPGYRHREGQPGPGGGRPGAAGILPGKPQRLPDPPDARGGGDPEKYRHGRGGSGRRGRERRPRQLYGAPDRAGHRQDPGVVPGVPVGAGTHHGGAGGPVPLSPSPHRGGHGRQARGGLLGAVPVPGGSASDAGGAAAAAGGGTPGPAAPAACCSPVPASRPTTRC